MLLEFDPNDRKIGASSFLVALVHRTPAAVRSFAASAVGHPNIEVMGCAMSFVFDRERRSDEAFSIEDPSAHLVPFVAGSDFLFFKFTCDFGKDYILKVKPSS